MPLIRSIESIPNGFRIETTRGGTHTFTRADIPANVLSRPIADVEAFANDWLETRFTPLGMFAAIKIRSVTPTLDARIKVANGPITEAMWGP